MQAVERSSLPPESKWNATTLFPTPEAWETAFQELQTDLSNIAVYHGTLNTANGIATWLEYAQVQEVKLNKLMVYALMDYSVDTGVVEAAARFDKLRSIAASYTAATAFAPTEILANAPEVRATWLDNELKDYAHAFDELSRKEPFLRSGEIEELLGSLGGVFGSSNSAHSVLANTDLTFELAKDCEGNTFEITQGTIRKLLGSTDRSLRKSAYENYANAHLDFKNTMATMLATGIKQNVFKMRIKNYDNSLEAALAPSHIPSSVFHNLIDTFKENLPTWHRYWEIRKKALKLDTLTPYDTFAPLCKKHPEISYEQSIEWLGEALAPLGDEYCSVMKQGALEGGWVDRYPNKGKRMGAFSAGRKGTLPYIMMSYTDDVFGMSTLAHELGHSMHSHFSCKTQPPIYARYTLFAAEVASNFNQAMLRAHLFDKIDDADFQIALIEEAMANFYRYFFVMPTLARFELEIHEQVERGEALSANSLIDLMSGLFAEGYGDVMTFDKDKVGITWAQFHTHLYSNFYVYTYATGISGAHSLANRILTGGAEAKEDYLTFLNAGGAHYPIDALKSAGVDLESPQAVKDTFEILKGHIDRLESLIS